MPAAHKLHPRRYTVICHAMDRLTRNLDDLGEVVLGSAERGIHVRFERENLTFTEKTLQCRTLS